MLNLWDLPVTDADTENVDRLASGANRMRRGYRFDIVRSRLRFGRELRYPTSGLVRTKLRKRVRAPGKSGGGRMADLPGDFEEPKLVIGGVTEGWAVGYGPHIPIRCRLLEEGHFD